MIIKECFFVGMGGFVGAVLRFLASGWVQKLSKSHFPYGTLAVNGAGSLVLGFLMGISLNNIVSPNIRLFVGIGLLGAFTTFSTFSYETLMLLKGGDYWDALLNVLVSLAIGLVLGFVGYISGQAIH